MLNLGPPAAGSPTRRGHETLKEGLNTLQEAVQATPDG